MILGMGKDAPARPAPQAEAEKVEKSPAQDKKAEPAEEATKRRGYPPAVWTNWLHCQCPLNKR